MLNRFAHAALLLLAIAAQGACAGEPEKIITLRRVNSFMESLLSIAERRLAQQATAVVPAEENEVARLINGEDEVAVLERLSTVSLNYLEPGAAKDQILDSVFDEAWYACIRKIEKVGGPAAIVVLERIGQERHLDGAYSTIRKASLERLRKGEAGRGQLNRHDL
jgi:hypothetical protein